MEEFLSVIDFSRSVCGMRNVVLGFSFMSVVLFLGFCSFIAGMPTTPLCCKKFKILCLQQLVRLNTVNLNPNESNLKVVIAPKIGVVIYSSFVYRSRMYLINDCAIAFQ